MGKYQDFVGIPLDWVIVEWYCRWKISSGNLYTFIRSFYIPYWWRRVIRHFGVTSQQRRHCHNKQPRALVFDHPRNIEWKMCAWGLVHVRRVHTWKRASCYRSVNGIDVFALLVTSCCDKSGTSSSKFRISAMRFSAGVHPQTYVSMEQLA
jgi:hypothetical protein